jgi:hypothetical protein
MRYYRDPNTGEVVAFDLGQVAWFDMRCDASTEYRVRFVPTEVTGEQAKTLQPLTEAEYLAERDQTNAANSAARSELFLKRTFPKGIDTL